MYVPKWLSYNGDGLRFSSSVKGVSNNYQNETRFYHYNGDKLMNITRNALNSSAGKISYIPSLTGYAGFVENGETLIYIKNAHSDVNATINAAGNVVDLYTYDEFGNVDYLQKTTDNRILYACEYFDTETGNYYLKARYYNPYTGRFTQRDPHWTPENMIYGDVTESTPAPDVRSSDYAVYVPTPIQRSATVLPTDNNKDDKVQGIIAETMAFSQSATYNGNLYESYFASFGNTEEGLFAAIIARQADNGAILQSTNLYVYCTNNPVMYVDPWGLEAQLDEYINSNYAGKKNITLVIKRPVANSRDAATIENGKLNNGHSFIRLDDGNGNVQYVGFGPESNSITNMILGRDVEGKFIDDSKTDWNVAKVYTLTDKQYTSISKYIDKMKKEAPNYNIETYNCTTFAVNTVKVGNAAVGNFMTVNEHSWTLPSDMEQQLANYQALPNWLSPGVAAWVINNTMGNFYGYTPADAAQDLKSAEGTVLLKYDGSVKTITNTYYFRSK